MQGQTKITRRSVLIVGGVMTGSVLIFAALTTFTFGYSVVGAFILSEIMGTATAALISGLLCVLLFDCGWIVGLLTYIYTAESYWQRAIALSQFITCFVFSLLGSVISVVLLSPLSQYVTESTLNVARYGGVSLLIIALAINATSFAVMNLTNPEVAKTIQAMSRKAEEIDFNARLIADLDDQTFTLAEQEIKKQIPVLARRRAEELLSVYVANMGHELNGLLPTTKTVLPTGSEIETPNQIEFDQFIEQLVEERFQERQVGFLSDK